MAGTIRHTPEVSAVVEGDDFYGPESSAWACFSRQERYERFCDHERLAGEVLRPLYRAEHTRYSRYHWQNNVLGNWMELRAEGVVVVENSEDGIRLWTDTAKYYERVFSPASSADLVLQGH